MQRIAIIGSGISGLGSAWFLHRGYEITVFESANYIGGHTHTVTVDDGGRAAPIDTGFMVFNHITYPHLTRLFSTLGVATKPTDMSFSVQHVSRELEYCGTSLNHLFAQRRNLLSPSFYRMLWQIDRFNREALAALDDPALRQMSLDDYVRRGRYGRDFFELYLIPMSSAVWSTPPDKMRQFPAATLLRFFHNHGFLGLHTQHPWWTVEGGAQSYVQKLIMPFQHRIHLRTPVRAVRRIPTSGVEVSTATAATRFDKVIFACHAPTVLEILGNDATSDERRLLGAFQYQPNTVTLHTDESVLPRTRLARAAWNYRIDSAGDGSGVSTHYWMNRLQGVSDRKNYFVSVEGTHLLDPNQTLHTFAEEHPLFDLGAAQAQTQIAGLNAAARGNTETYFAGAWQRYGFHEDGLLSAVNLATLLLGHDAWSKTPAPKEQP
jgi:predicted NAD/FAD-binding protein